MAEIPPWLTPQSAQGYGQLAAEGARIGQSRAIAQAQLSQEAARMQQQFAVAQMEIQSRQEQQAREDMVRQQQLEIEKSYKEQMLAMQKEELQQRQQEFQLKTQQAARQFQAQQKFRDYIQSAGDNPNYPMGAAQSGLDFNPAEIINFSKMQRQAQPPSVETYGEGPNQTQFVKAPSPGGGFVLHPLRPPNQNIEERMMKMRELKESDRLKAEKRAGLRKAIATLESAKDPTVSLEKRAFDMVKLYESTKKGKAPDELMHSQADAWDQRQKRIEELKQQLSEMEAGGDGAPAGGGGFKVLKIEPVDSGDESTPTDEEY